MHPILFCLKTNISRKAYLNNDLVFNAPEWKFLPEPVFSDSNGGVYENFGADHNLDPLFFAIEHDKFGCNGQNSG